MKTQKKKPQNLHKREIFLDFYRWNAGNASRTSVRGLNMSEETEEVPDVQFIFTSSYFLYFINSLPLINIGAPSTYSLSSIRFWEINRCISSLPSVTSSSKT